jgi:tetratricopeptide (TPR) repeat protein
VLAVLLALGPAAVAFADTPEDTARAAEASGDLEAAIDAWQRAIEASPKTAAAYEALGRLQLEAGRAPEAVRTFERMVDALPEHPRARTHLGFALRKAGRHREAAEAYRAQAEATPEAPDPWFGLGESLRQLGDKSGALRAYRRYVELESRPSEAEWVARANEEIAKLSQAGPTRPGSERPVARQARRSERGAQGVPAGGDAAQGDPARGDPDKADAHFEAGRYAEASASYAARIDERPEAVAPRYRRAVSAALAGDALTAESEALAAAQLDPGNPDARAVAILARAQRDRAGKRPSAEPPSLEAAELALAEGRFRAALEMADTLLDAQARAPARARAGRLSWVRGRALLGLDRADEALSALKTAAGHGLATPAVWLDLGAATERLGDREGARYYYRLAADALPADDPVAARARARLGEGGGR